MKKIFFLLAVSILSLSLQANELNENIKPEDLNKTTKTEQALEDLWEKFKDWFSDMIEYINPKKSEKEEGAENSSLEKSINTSDNSNTHYNCSIPLGTAGVAEVESDKKFECDGILEKINENKDKSNLYNDANVQAIES